MKKSLIIISLMFFWVVSSLGQIPTDHLIAWYPFNGNANDISGNGNNGTVNGATLTTDRFGNSNSSYSFNGINSIITINNTLANFGTSDFTIAGWINLSNYISGTSCIFAKRNVGVYSNLIEFQSNSWKIGGEIDESNSSNYSVVYSTSLVSLNAWYFGTFVRQGNLIKMYFNSTLEATTTTPIIQNINNSAVASIGDWGAGVTYFNGKIDDIRIYNRALTQSEITALYNESSSSTITTSSNPTNGGSTSGGGTYQNGSPVTVNASAYSGYNFSNWTENGVVVSTSSNYFFYASGNRNLVANFIPIQSIMVTSPNGGEIWQVGCTYNITWTSTGVSNVKIEYSSNSGSTWNTIVTSYPASNNSYSWPIPNTPSGSCLVKVSDVSNPSIFDISNSPFTISNGGAPVNGLLAWYPFNGNANDMSGNGNNGTVNGAILTTDRFGNSNSAYNFNGSTDFISINNTLGNFGTSDFSIVGWFNQLQYQPGLDIIFAKRNTGAWGNLLTFNVVYENSAVRLCGEVDESSPSNYSVVHSNTMVTTNIWYFGCFVRESNTIKLYINGSFDNSTSTATIQNINNNATASIGAFNNGTSWNSFFNGKIDDIRIFNRALSPSEITQLYNENLSTSITVTSPNGYESWQVGTAQNITWTSTNISNVKLEYTYDNGSTWNVIVNGYPASTGTYSWVVPNTPSTQCKVRISDANNSCTNDFSDNNFTITSGSSSSILVLSPNGGEIWQVGYNYNISWTSSGVSQVNIEYSTNNGNSWSPIVNNYPSSGTSSYQWTVPNTPSSQCKVRITDSNNPTTWDVSDNVFTILGSGSSAITVLSPNGNEIWLIGLSYYIIWNSTNVTNVRIDYSIDGGFSWIPIVYSTPASVGYYSWIVPNTPSTNCMVKISDVANPAFFDVSDNPFTISLTTGLDEAKERFQVFPNPSYGYFKIKSSEVIKSVTIFNLMGETLEDFKVENIETSMDVSSLGAGIYYFKINFQNSFKIKKVVVM